MTNYEKVREFQKAFNQPLDIASKDFSADRHGMRLDLIKEEFIELCQACAVDDPIERVDALTDIIYVCYGYMAEMGIDADEAFKRVHDSNMAKLGADGKPIVNGENGVHDMNRPIGKVLKPEGWKPPVFNDLLKEAVTETMDNFNKGVTYE